MFPRDLQHCNHLPPEGKYHYLLVAVHCDDLGIAVWLAGVVDEPGLIAGHGGIHYLVSINTEHVATNTLGGWEYK